MNRINQPDRISVDSFQDTTTATNGQYYTFVNTSPNTSLVGAKKIHLLRCTIPYIQMPIPTYQLVFYYYATDAATDVPEAADLRAVRLYPHDYTPPTGFGSYTLNEFFQTPSDLVTALNAASAAGGDDVTYNTLYVANDLTFSYNAVLNQIYFEGNDPTKFYTSAGFNDPIVQASQASTAISIYNFDGTTSRQPYALGYTLNLRCGFACDGVNIPRGSGNNLVSVKCAQLTGTLAPANGSIYADTFPNLNYTSNVYIYSNIVGNSGFGSTRQRNLLGVIPMNVPLGAIAHYDGHSAPAYSTKVPSDIYSVDIELRDDANQPFYLPTHTANVNIELGILY